MDVTEGERQVLIAVTQILARKRREPTREAVAEVVPRLFEDKALGVDAALASLVERGLLSRAGPEAPFLPDAEGLALGQELGLEYERSGFDDWLVKSEACATFVEYCRRVHGTPFIQFNMVDAEQIGRLLDFLGLSPGDRLADLGCGLGTQAEHISDRTGARVTGLDFAPGAIRRASERTVAKADRLSFVLGDLNDIRLPKASFDAVVFFDTLYFVEDPERTIASAVALLVPGGRLAIFYSQDRVPEDPADRLEPRGTEAGKALVRLGIEFETTDFTASEGRIWKESLAAATELKSAFEAEGGLELWKSRDEEARSQLGLFESGSTVRYLYTARP